MRTETVGGTSMVCRVRTQGHAGKSIARESAREAPWTLGRILQCTRAKIERMEEREPPLRRFVLVHKLMSSVEDDLDPDTLAVGPGGQVQPLAVDMSGDTAPLMTEAARAPRPGCSVIVKRSGGHSLRRRRRLATSVSRPNIVSSSSEVLSNRPIKKRRLKRLLGDAGCFAAATATISLGAQ
eukprot:m.444090 g.444090  ORF g.444090 m.444090 type:complete len:182 (-) comp19046_c0_seq1:107-652(-)